MNDLIFLNRNQAYGAYLIRSIYDRNMSRAIIIASLLFLFILSMPFILKAFEGSKFISEICEDSTITIIDFPNPEPPREPESRDPNPRPIKSTMKSIYVKVIADSLPISEELPPSNEELNNIEIGAENIIGLSEGVSDPLVNTNSDGGEAVITTIEEPFKYVEQMPEFPDGYAAMYNYLKHNIDYPSFARENGIQGSVIIQFVVSSSGDLTKVSIARGIGGGCDEEALRVVRSMPNWKPGKHYGKSVPVIFTLPINFKLE
ncbi:MAG: energy transducer TonB [Saprospiraceae bacterium]